MKKHLLLLMGLFFIAGGMYAQTSLEGKITDNETKEGLISAEVVLYKNEVFITGTTTDFDGNFALVGIEPGTYDVEAKYLGYQSVRETGVLVKDGKVNRISIALEEGGGVLIDEITIKAYKAPLIEQDNTTQGKVVTAEEIRSLPTKSINSIAATSSGLSTSDRDSDVSIRGSRSDATNYYVDGMRVSAASIPASEIDQLQVITGGMEAKYGDVTGGIISITSKGPSQKFTGGIEAETSEKLDQFGYNLLSANVSGPILKNSEGKSIIGFRLAGQYTNIKDTSPPAKGTWRLPADQIALLEENPTRFLGNIEYPSANFIGSEEMGEISKYRPNEGDVDFNVTGKFDIRATDAIDLSLSAGYDNSKDQFTPGNASGGGAPGWRILNWTHNPFDYEHGFRSTLRFRHKIGKQGLGSDEEDGEGEVGGSSIRNAFYTIQLGYENRKGRREDQTHQDNLFGYGHYGAQAVTSEPFANNVTDEENYHGDIVYVPTGGLGPGIPYSHLANQEIAGEFDAANSSNPTIAKYSQINGFTGNALFDVWNGLYENVGQVYNRFDKDESDRYTLNISSGFDFLPGGSESGRHSMQIGLTYEQRVDRFYVILPEQLWTLARLNANRHIIGLDTNNVIGTFTQSIFTPATQMFEDYTFQQYQTLISPDSDLSFFKRVREATGQSLNEFINVDALTPDQMRLDYFSAGELNNQGIINYYGYDYLGEKLSTSTKFDDFFTSTDDDGVRTFDVAPLQPIYGAAFIQDKFSYKDIIFRLGLRVDYYDANTKVLKDPYSLYDIETAKDFFARTGQEQPETVGDDYKVYVGGEDSEVVQAFRSGDQFFLPNGTSSPNSNTLFSGEVFPSYVERDEQKRDIQFYQRNADGTVETYNVDNSFEDYKPQINFMPRLAFSFPISEDANFFAHYDILVQRPPSGTEATARSYYYFNNPDRTPTNNPNLRPEKTIDYEVGFQQKITNSSAIKVSAYYKELRDMIQQRTFFNIPSPVNDYQAYGNLDFGTVKGFSVNYDLRRTNNIQLTGTYTLQFADGTGSDPDFAQDLVSRGNIRTLLPLSFDERHRITGTVDYRYDSGAKYNGPKVMGKDIFANAGLNFILTTISGRPYSRFQTAESVSNGTGRQYVGSINGARLPWQYRLDLRADKSFAIGLGGEESKRKLRCNVYLRVANLLDTRNAIDVFPVTSDPEDDGFLASSFGQDQQQQAIQNGFELNNFLASYQWRLLDAGNFSLPRRIYVGAIFDF